LKIIVKTTARTAGELEVGVREGAGATALWGTYSSLKAAKIIPQNEKVDFVIAIITLVLVVIGIYKFSLKKLATKVCADSKFGECCIKPCLWSNEMRDPAILEENVGMQAVYESGRNQDKTGCIEVDDDAARPLLNRDEDRASPQQSY
jgi:hypothetical protein